MIVVAFLVSVAFSASPGPTVCDALGICSEQSSMAFPRTDVDVSNFNQNTNMKWVVDGCARLGTAFDNLVVDIDNPASWGQDGFNTACCSDEPSGVTCHAAASPNQRPSGATSGSTYCNPLKTLDESRAYCESYGWRLCTKPEIESEVCCSLSGCGLNGKQIWVDGRVDYWKCPKGMNKVAPPVRHDGYRVFADSDSYTPGEALTIHVEVLDKTKKYLGLLMYAVLNDADSFGPSGCPDPGDGTPTNGCDGKVENRVGSWEMNGSPDFKVGSCTEVVTHSHAGLKKFNETFTWIAPDSGHGEVIFRVLLKHGSTNGGMFFWPMQQDLVLREGSEVQSSASWHTGHVSKSCNEVCADAGKACDMNTETFTSLAAYDEMKRSPDATCQMPLLSSCQHQGPTKDSSTGHCWLGNRASSQCPGMELHVACCGSNGARECGGAMSYQAAQDFCSTRGMNVCPRSAYQSCRVSCQQNNLEYWTRDETTECESPFELLCENCRCKWQNRVGRSDTEYECGMLVQSQRERDGTDYKYVVTIWDDTQNNYKCHSSITEDCTTSDVNMGGDLGSVYALGSPVASPATSVCDGCKCGGSSNNDVTVTSLLDCQKESTKAGFDYFSFNANGGVCHPANAQTCGEDSRTDNANFNTYFAANFSCTTKVWTSKDCGAETLIDIPEVYNVDDSSDVCESKALDGGDERLCKCGAALASTTTTSETGTSTTRNPGTSGNSGASGNTANSDNDGSSMVPIIAGACAGAVCILLCIIGGFYWKNRRMDKVVEGKGNEFSFGNAQTAEGSSGGGHLGPNRSLEGAPPPPPQHSPQQYGRPKRSPPRPKRPVPPKRQNNTESHF